MNRIEFVILIAVTVFVIMVWIIADIYHTKASVSVSPQLSHALEPLDPNFDLETLEQIKKRGPSATKSPQSTATPTPTPSATPTATPSPTPTPSGTQIP